MSGRETTGRVDGELEIRGVGFQDATALGFMVYTALHQAPSAPVIANELGDDLLGLGHDLVHGATYGEERILVALAGGQPLGLVRVLPREFVRGAHIGIVQVLVSLVARKRGVGSSLMEALTRDPQTLGRFERLEVTMTAHDLGLHGLIAAFNRRDSGDLWCRERVEINGMRVDGTFDDVETWVIDLASSPSP